MFKIGVLGRNLEESIKILQEIYEIESKKYKNKLIHTSHECAWLWEENWLDNIKYYALSNELVRGLRLDQIIISDNDLIDDYFNQVIMPCLSSSPVPEEFLVQVFE